MKQKATEQKYIDDAKVFKAFCDENRLKILEMLCSGEICACNLLKNLNIGQSTLSHHLKILCDADIVESRIEGKWTYYSVNPDGVRHAKILLNGIAVANPSGIPELCGCDE